MYISGINYESLSDGEGVRTTIFFSGCKWNCKGCHNKDTHSFTYGKPFTKEMQNEIISYLKSVKYINGITLSGGDPMFNAKEVLSFVQELKKELLNTNVWCYTGFTFEEILNAKDDKLELLKECNVLVDGRFMQELRDITLKFRGSRNQRLINVQQSLKENKVIEVT